MHAWVLFEQASPSPWKRLIWRPRATAKCRFAMGGFDHHGALELNDLRNTSANPILVQAPDVGLRVESLRARAERRIIRQATVSGPRQRSGRSAAEWRSPP